jgi:hypothetical protein
MYEVPAFQFKEGPNQECKNSLKISAPDASIEEVYRQG